MREIKLLLTFKEIKPYIYILFLSGIYQAETSLQMREHERLIYTGICLEYHKIWTVLKIVISKISFGLSLGKFLPKMIASGEIIYRI